MVTAKFRHIGPLTSPLCRRDRMLSPEGPIVVEWIGRSRTCARCPGWLLFNTCLALTCHSLKSKRCPIIIGSIGEHVSEDASLWAKPANTFFGRMVLINLGPRGFESRDPFGRPGRTWGLARCSFRTVHANSDDELNSDASCTYDRIKAIDV
jgi:hypothetical protein